jgi:type IV secretory pathway VirB2 component (pilin)
MNVRYSLKDFPLLAAVKSAIMADKIRRFYTRVIVGTLTWFLAPLAHADDDIAGMITAVLNGVTSLKEPIIKASMVIGLACILIAIGLMAGKKNNPQIKIWHVLILMVAGACFIGIDQISSRSQKQMNLNPVSVG